MKRLAMLLALCLALGACAAPAEPTTEAPSSPSETTQPTEAVIPPETTRPDETTVPTESAPVETTPPESQPSETTLPPDDSYTVKLTDPETLIYDGPAFRSSSTATLGASGVYTIVEEATDSDGNLWGRLKSGIGWVCLTQPPIVPIHAQYAPDHFVPTDAWHCGETEYVTDIGILANETLTDVTFTRLGIDPEYVVDEVLYTIDTMHPDAPMLLSVVFYGDLTTYGVSFTDAKGSERFFALYISGKDGSLICSEYSP